ncbi:uncharacterized protein [Dysidea avara]|uniref:uncharacterized protein n=1 Tax=Dysidea avara TaxID=196820 RepID=UPI00332AB8D3
MVTDNGPQFASGKCWSSEAYGFRHITTSPHYPQANGLAERMVRTVKGLLEHTSDPYKALLSYRATRLPWCGLSPAELLMGRKIRTDTPEVKTNFIPHWSYIDNLKNLDQKVKLALRDNYNSRHQVKELPQLPEGQTVWVETRGQQTPGRVVQAANTPRSYTVETPMGQVRRNRTHLRIRTEVPMSNAGEESPTCQTGLLHVHNLELSSDPQIV